MNILKKVIKKMLITIKQFQTSLFLKYKKNLIIKGKVELHGLPIINNKVGEIILHDNVLLNSSNKNYLINLHSPVKLFTSMSNAKIVIGENTRIHGTCIHAYESVEIGRNCLIAANCNIFDNNRHELHFDNPEKRLINSNVTKPVKISDNVWIGANCFILPGVTIGEGSVIAAGSIVVKDVKPFTLNGGNPCKEIKFFDRDKNILLKS